VQVVRELDEIAGTTGSDMYSKTQIFAFLRTKGWVIEELADVPDTLLDNEQPTSPQQMLQLLWPKSHVVFSSSSSDSGSTEGPAVKQDDTGPAKEVVEDMEPDDEDDDDDEEQSDRAFRSAYVGRGNVKAVRAARKRAGLSDGFLTEGHRK